MGCEGKCPGKGTCSGKCRALGRVGDLCRGGMALVRAGDHGVAERVLRFALEMTREYELGPVLEAKAANGLGLAMHAGGKLDEALDEFTVALRLLGGRLGTENRLYGVIHGNYVQVLGERERSAATRFSRDVDGTSRGLRVQGGAECRN